MNNTELKIKKAKQELLKIILATVLAPLATWALVLLGNMPDISGFFRLLTIASACLCFIVSMFFTIGFLATKCWFELFDDIKTMEKELKDNNQREHDFYIKDCKRKY